MDLSETLKEGTNARVIWYLRSSKRKYSDIMKYLGERDSGKVNYHLKRLVSHGLIVKEGDYYSLSAEGVKNALYVDSLQLKEKYPLPVVVVAIVRGDKILLAKRCRVPLKNYWGLPGNELLYGESVLESAKKEVELELGFQVSGGRVYGSYPTIYSENSKLVYHVILIAVKVRAGEVPQSGKASGKVSEYKFFSKSEIEKLNVIPSNMQPILDAFSNSKKILEQDL